MLHMDADLVGAPCLQNERYKAVFVFLLYNAIMCDRIFAVFKINPPLNQRTACPSDGSIYCPRRRNKVSPDDRAVFAGYLMPCGHARQDAGADHMLCNDSETGGIPVQPVGTPEDKRFSLRLIVIHESIGEGVAVIIERWMYGHPRWFVYDYNILILINNIDREPDRRDIWRGLCFLDVDGESIAGAKGYAHVFPGSVSQDALGHFFQLCKILIGIAFPAKVLLNAQPVGKTVDLVCDRAFHEMTPVLYGCARSNDNDIVNNQSGDVNKFLTCCGYLFTDPVSLSITVLFHACLLKDRGRRAMVMELRRVRHIGSFEIYLFFFRLNIAIHREFCPEIQWIRK